MKSAVHTMAVAGLLAGTGALRCGAATWAEELIAGYETVKSVRCEIRRDVDGGAGRGRWLSIVFFERPDRLHVRNTLPLKRTIVCDGSVFHSHVEGDPLGFARPVGELSDEMLLSLRRVPGTAMDYLLRVRGLPETNLPPVAPFVARRGYATTNRFIVFSADASNRPARVEIFDNTLMTNRLMRCDYSLFAEARPGVWIPQLQDSEATIGRDTIRETLHVDHLEIDPTIEKALWESDRWLRGVTFTNRFDAIYP